MHGVNRVTLIGNVGKDPETRYLENGVAVSTFSLATTETYKNKNGEKVTSTEWHNIVLWRGLAEITEKYVRKGSPLYIDGKIRTRSWEDKEGNRRFTTEIIGSNMIMLETKGNHNGNHSYKDATHIAENTPSIETIEEIHVEESDDLPF